MFQEFDDVCGVGGDEAGVGRGWVGGDHVDTLGGAQSIQYFNGDVREWIQQFIPHVGSGLWEVGTLLREEQFVDQSPGSCCAVSRFGPWWEFVGDSGPTAQCLQVNGYGFL